MLRILSIFAKDDSSPSRPRVSSVINSNVPVADRHETPDIVLMAQRGDADSIQKLLHDKPSAIHDSCSLGHGAVDIAAERNDIAVMRVLAQNGADVNRADAYGRTPRDWALVHNNNEMLSLIDSAA